MRFLSALTEAFDTIIEDRHPGLIEHRLIPCACRNRDGRRCSHAFLRELLRSLDPKNEKNWGALSPISRPEDRRIIYLWPDHVRGLEYPVRRHPAPGRRQVTPARTRVWGRVPEVGMDAPTSGTSTDVTRGPEPMGLAL